MSSKDKDEEDIMHSKKDNKEIKINDKADEVIETLLKSLLNRYQGTLETSMRRSDSMFDSVILCLIYFLYNKSHERIVLDQI